MDHVLKVVIIADAHIGADKFDTHPDRWDAPVREAFNFAVDNKADLVISAGDFMHKRNPTVHELLRRQELLDILIAAAIPYLEVDGNHDRSNAAGSHSALEIADPSAILDSGHLWQGRIQYGWFGKTKIVGLPWPRPVDYLNDEEMKLSIDEKVALTRERIYANLSVLVHDTPNAPTILFGHAMLMYGIGEVEPTDPGLILGKDVTLRLRDLAQVHPLSEHQIFMGHVHDPAARGYVGSTQPTDWGDAEHDKSFTELVIVENSAGATDPLTADGFTATIASKSKWWYATKLHSYADQLQLHDIVIDNVTPDMAYDDIIREQLVATPIDIVRITVNLKDGGTANEAVVRDIFEARPNYGRVDRVIINHPAREAVRVETETPLTDMPEDEAFETWLKQSGFTDEQAAGPYAIFQELIGANK